MIISFLGPWGTAVDSTAQQTMRGRNVMEGKSNENQNDIFRLNTNLCPISLVHLYIVSLL